MSVLANRKMRILLATGARDEFVNIIESSMMRVATEHGSDLLLIVEGRDVSDLAIPTIDLEELADAGELAPSRYQRILGDLGRIIDDTRWFAQLRGYPCDSSGIEDKLVAAAFTIDRILDQYRPHIVLTWNGLLGIRAVVARRAEARGIPVLFCERGALPGSWCADPRGVNAASSIAVPPLPADLQAMLDSPLDEADRRSTVAEIEATARVGASAWEQAGLRGPDAWRAELDLEPGRPVLFFPMQVDADTNMRFFSPHFSGSLPALKAVARAVRSMPGWFLLVKPHPKGTYPPGAIERALGDAGRCVADINLHDALSLSSLVVTINSTVACEAAWSGKPVLQLGNGILSGKEIIGEYDPQQPLDRQLLTAIEQWRQDTSRLDRGLKFHRYLRYRHLLGANSDTDTNRLIDRIEAMVGHKAENLAGATARSVCDLYVWLPAQRLLDRIAACRQRHARVLLVGYGRNARKLLAAAADHPVGRGLSWAVWDDSPEAQAQAALQGLTVERPGPTHDPIQTLLVVTPRNPEPLASKLDSLGYERGDEYWTLFSIPKRNGEAADATAVSAVT